MTRVVVADDIEDTWTGARTHRPRQGRTNPCILEGIDPAGNFQKEANGKPFIIFQPFYQRGAPTGRGIP
jgi:hypothetical protein